ncbi:MAG: 2-C-methyl-D-erythritol 4-phosphate cytidylyltransferase [Candidatus Omnitrophica bacterium]|nr:2-C-methyl-D-erythritol 4-phosphate cytidylyltransferase [Candidatus Omnitrophota bacterium]
MRVSAILLAAGKGERFKSKISKPLVKIGSLSLIAYSLRILSGVSSISEIIVVSNHENKEAVVLEIRKHRIVKVKKIVLGGKLRQDSVYNGLKAVDAAADLVLIHDSARPFIDKKMVLSVIKEADAFGAAIVGVPVKATIKKVTSRMVVAKTIDRSDLWEIQTPQVFRKKLIERAFEKCGRGIATDDAMLVEKLSEPVSVVLGSYNNIKVTTPEDLVIAQAIVKLSKA